MVNLIKYRQNREEWSTWRFSNLVQNLIFIYYEKQVKLGSMTSLLKCMAVSAYSNYCRPETLPNLRFFMNLSKSGCLITWILRHITNSQQGQTLCKVTVLRWTMVSPADRSRSCTKDQDSLELRRIITADVRINTHCTVFLKVPWLTRYSRTPLCKTYEPVIWEYFKRIL